MKEPFWAKKNKARWEQLKFNTLTLMLIEKNEGALHCEYCNEQNLRVHQWHEKMGEDTATADHFYAKCNYPDLAKEPKNIVVACSKCNEKKDDKEPNIKDIKYPRNAKVINDLTGLI